MKKTDSTRGRRIVCYAQLIAVIALLVGSIAPAHAQLFKRSQTKNLSGGIEAGGLIGQTELKDKMAPHMRAFMRLRVSKTLQAELGIGSGRMAGDDFGTDMMLMDLKAVFNALNKQNWTPLFIGVGIGALRYDLDKISPKRTVQAEPTGWSAMVPMEAGTQVVLMKNVAFEAKASFTFVFSDDLNSLNEGHDNDSFRMVSASLVLGHLRRQ